MIDPEDFQTFLELDVKFFASSRSLLKDICSCFSKFLNERHIIACNEGVQFLGIGHYLATSRPALIYLQTQV